MSGRRLMPVEVECGEWNKGSYSCECETDAKDILKVSLKEPVLNVGGEEGKVFLVTSRILDRIMGSVTEMGTLGMEHLWMRSAEEQVCSYPKERV